MTALPVPPGVGVAAVLAALRRWGVGGKVAELLCPFPRGVGVAAVLAALRRWGGREGSTKLLCPFRGRGPGRAKLCLPDPATARYRRGTSLPTRNIATDAEHRSRLRPPSGAAPAVLVDASCGSRSGKWSETPAAARPTQHIVDRAATLKARDARHRQAA